MKDINEKHNEWINHKIVAFYTGKTWGKALRANSNFEANYQISKLNIFKLYFVSYIICLQIFYNTELNVLEVIFEMLF